MPDTLVTTLLDHELYSLDDIAELYRRRWEVETNFGHIKTTMGMDVLKCKTIGGVLRDTSRIRPVLQPCATSDARVRPASKRTGRSNQFHRHDQMVAKLRPAIAANEVTTPPGPA